MRRIFLDVLSLLLLQDVYQAEVTVLNYGHKKPRPHTDSLPITEVSAMDQNIQLKYNGLNSTFCQMQHFLFFSIFLYILHIDVTTI